MSIVTSGATAIANIRAKSIGRGGGGKIPKSIPERYSRIARKIVIAINVSVTRDGTLVKSPEFSMFSITMSPMNARRSVVIVGDKAKCSVIRLGIV